VDANTTSVETRNAGVGTVIESQRILDLPLNGRQPTDLITLSGLSVQTGTSPTYTIWTGRRIWIRTWGRTCPCPFPMPCKSLGW
jgi:hypothetical protein